MNQVLCPLPSLDSYLIDISNDGDHVTGSGRYFVPHDPVCYQCYHKGHGVTCTRKVLSLWSCLLPKTACYHGNSDTCTIVHDFATFVLKNIMNIWVLHFWHPQLIISGKIQPSAKGTHDELFMPPSRAWRKGLDLVHIQSCPTPCGVHTKIIQSCISFAS